jgi:hypothetical protein
MRHEQVARVFEQRSKRLWIAVVQQAIDDAMGRASFAPGSPEEIRSIQREALSWIFQDRSPVANSFHSICDLLDIDPTGLASTCGRILRFAAGLPVRNASAAGKGADRCSGFSRGRFAPNRPTSARHQPPGDHPCRTSPRRRDSALPPVHERSTGHPSGQADRDAARTDRPDS